MRISRKNKKRKPAPADTKKDVNAKENINGQLQESLNIIQKIFNKTPDLTIRPLLIKQTKEQAFLVYLKSIIDSKTIFKHILKPLLFEEGAEKDGAKWEVSLGPFRKTMDWNQIEDAVLNGECVLFVENSKEAFIFNTPEFPKRAVEESKIETSITGAHIGFTENVDDNIALIRKHIRNRELKIHEMTVGERGKSKVSILYLEDVANPDVLEILKKRIGNLKIDAVINAGILAEYIEDYPYAVFPQMLLTERPDFAAEEILQGRYAVVVDRSPTVIICPATFDSFFKTIDDYSSRWIVASFIRLLRFVGFIIAVFLPAFYIAVISFHFEILPLELLFSIAESRERIPFPPYIEAFLMELTLEMLREAGIRLPEKIGQTVGIVGGIIIGQAAVEAGIVSNIMVIVVALTAVASFIIPNYEMSSAIRLVRFPMMILAALFGFVGITAGAMMLLAHFLVLESAGTPYSSPFAPLKLSDWKDSLIIFPQKYQTKRPLSTKSKQIKRAEFNRRDGGQNGR